MNVLNAFIGFIAAIVLVGCSANDPTAPPVSLKLERGKEGFHASWEFAEPVRALSFTRNGGFRSSEWRGKDGVRVERRGAKEILISDQARTRFEIFIPAHETKSPGDYPFIIPYSDGGVVLYTGFLLASPVECFSECTDEEVAYFDQSPSRTSFRIDAAFDENIVIDGGTVSASIDSVLGREGSFVYFGRQIPRTVGNLKILADTSIPLWVLEEIQRTFPRVMTFAHENLRYSLGQTPIIFVPQGDAIGSLRSDSNSGAVVGYQMLLSFSGDAWRKQNDQLKETLRKLIAHETFHFWNGSLFKSTMSSGGEWLHEGAAEAFSYVALRDLGEISNERFQSIEEESLNRCLLGSVRSPYDCGAIMHLTLSRSLEMQNKDIWSFWREMFAAAAENGNKYSDHEFFSAAGKTPVRSSLVEIANRQTSGYETASFESDFSQMYRRTGRELVFADYEWPLWYSRYVAERVLEQALQADCGPLGLTSSRDIGQVRLGGGSACKVLREDVDVDFVGPHRLWIDGVAAYDYVYDTCRTQDVFRVRTVRDNSRLSVKCPEIGPRPRYIRLL